MTDTQYTILDHMTHRHKAIKTGAIMTIKLLKSLDSYTGEHARMLDELVSRYTELHYEVLKELQRDTLRRLNLLPDPKNRCYELTKSIEAERDRLLWVWAPEAQIIKHPLITLYESMTAGYDFGTRVLHYIACGHTGPLEDLKGSVKEALDAVDDEDSDDEPWEGNVLILRPSNDVE